MRLVSYLVSGLLALTGVAFVAAPAHAAVTGTYDGTTTTITSDASSDTMVLTCGANQVLVNGVLPTGSGGTCTSRLVVLGNGGDDVIDIRGLSTSSFQGITLDAGDGNDRVDGTQWTVGNTSDIFIGGGAGDDVMFPHGSDLVRAGPGNDTLSDLNPEIQLLDGESGTDTYTFDFSVFGSASLDFNLTTGGLVLQLSGTSTLQRWTSVEVVDIGLNEANNALRAGGFEGVVKANGAGGNDAMTGGPGADTLVGGPGDDTLDGGPGIDRIEGGDGSELVRVRDGEADSVDCGAAPDIAVTDQVDVLAGCESVDAAPTPVPPDTTKPGVVLKKAVLKSGTHQGPRQLPRRAALPGYGHAGRPGQGEGQEAAREARHAARRPRQRQAQDPQAAADQGREEGRPGPGRSQAAGPLRPDGRRRQRDQGHEEGRPQAPGVAVSWNRPARHPGWTLGAMSTAPTAAPEAGLHERPPHARHFTLAVLALAMGGFAIGTTEFVTMGLLPQIADGVAISIPTAGNVISAYAVGVVIGAPVLAFLGARLPRRGLLVALMVAYAVGNAASALASTYGAAVPGPGRHRLPARRVLRGGLVGGRLAGPGGPQGSRRRDGDARALGRERHRRAGRHLAGPAPRLAGGVLGRDRPGPPDRRCSCSRSCRPARATRRPPAAVSCGRSASPQVWLTLLAGAVGFGGMFAVYSYIAPTVTEVGGLPEGAVPAFLLAFGVGMVVGTWLAGELADWSVFRSLLGSALGLVVVLLLFSALAPARLVAAARRLRRHGPRLGAGGEPAAAADGRRR